MKAPRKNRRIRPSYQRDFVQWFRRNQERFVLPIWLVTRTKINVEITIPGLTPLISFGLASNALMVWVNNKDGDNFGVLADLNIAPKKRGRGFINRLCLPEDEVAYPNLTSLRRAEIYESFLEWVNQKLANATWINLVQSKGGSVGADLVYRDSVINQTTNDIRLGSALVDRSGEHIYDPERDEMRSWLYPLFPENYHSGISHLNFALEQGDLKTKVLNHPHKATNIVALPTWFDDLERMTFGFQAGQLIVVGGRPAMGKTAFALNIAAYVALNRELPVGIFSLENTGENLAMRLVSSVGRVSTLCMETDNLNDNEWSRISSAIGQLTESYIFFDDTKWSCPITINAGAQRLSRCWGGHLGLLIIDCIQQINGNKQGSSGETDIAEIMRTLKSIARNLSVPVLALSQLPEEVDMRKEKRPTLSDLGEKGAIEQQADLVLMLYRDEYSDPDTPDKGLAEVIIRKSNNASDGTLALAFNSEYGCFENLP